MIAIPNLAWNLKLREVQKKCIFPWYNFNDIRLLLRVVDKKRHGTEDNKK